LPGPSPWPLFVFQRDRSPAGLEPSDPCGIASLSVALLASFLPLFFHDPCTVAMHRPAIWPLPGPQQLISPGVSECPAALPAFLSAEPRGLEVGMPMALPTDRSPHRVPLQSDRLRQHLSGLPGHDRAGNSNRLTICLSIFTARAGHWFQMSQPPDATITTHLPTCSPKPLGPNCAAAASGSAVAAAPPFRLVPLLAPEWGLATDKLNRACRPALKSHPPSKGGPQALKPTQVGLFSLRYRTSLPQAPSAPFADA